MALIGTYGISGLSVHFSLQKPNREKDILDIEGLLPQQTNQQFTGIRSSRYEKRETESDRKTE